MLLQTHDADARQLDASIQHLDGSGEAPSPCLRVLRLGNSIRSPLRSLFLRTRQLSTPAGDCATLPETRTC